MTTWNELMHFAGLDWAGDHHDVAVVEGTGQVVAEFRCAHRAAGWAEFRKQMTAYPAWGVALETRSGAAVEELLQSKGTVFPVQPKAAARYRERKGAQRREGRCWMPDTRPHGTQGHWDTGTLGPRDGRETTEARTGVVDGR